MDLKEFVGTCLEQVIEGIQDAQKQTLGSGAEINVPPDMESDLNTIHNGKRQLQQVEFDVALTRQNETGGGIEVAVPAVANLGFFGRRTSKDGSVSRIRFSVGVAFPPSPVVASRSQPKLLVADRVVDQEENH